MNPQESIHNKDITNIYFQIQTEEVELFKTQHFTKNSLHTWHEEQLKSKLANSNHSSEDFTECKCNKIGH